MISLADQLCSLNELIVKMEKQSKDPGIIATLGNIRAPLRLCLCGLRYDPPEHREISEQEVKEVLKEARERLWKMISDPVLNRMLIDCLPPLKADMEE